MSGKYDAIHARLLEELPDGGDLSRIGEVLEVKGEAALTRLSAALSNLAKHRKIRISKVTRPAGKPGRPRNFYTPIQPEDITEPAAPFTPMARQERASRRKSAPPPPPTTVSHPLAGELLEFRKQVLAALAKTHDDSPACPTCEKPLTDMELGRLVRAGKIALADPIDIEDAGGAEEE